MNDKHEFMQIRFYVEPLGDGTDRQMITIVPFGMNGIPCDEGTALLEYAKKCTLAIEKMGTARTEEEIKPVRDELNAFLKKQDEK